MGFDTMKISRIITIASFSFVGQYSRAYLCLTDRYTWMCFSLTEVHSLKNQRKFITLHYSITIKLLWGKCCNIHLVHSSELVYESVDQTSCSFPSLWCFVMKIFHHWTWFAMKIYVAALLNHTYLHMSGILAAHPAHKEVLSNIK